MRLSHIEARIEQQIELTKLISDIYDDLVEHDVTRILHHEILLRLNVLKEDWQKFATIHDAINIAITKLNLTEENKIKEHFYFSDNLFVTTRKNYITNCGRLQSLLESDQISGKESTPSQSLCTSSNPIVVSY